MQWSEDSDEWLTVSREHSTGDVQEWHAGVVYFCPCQVC